uniref:TGF-beta family profile domain-containing protein n=1 Tax=Gasterosteus aculeatus aculeatus TaxID=481459 RepID=G3PMP0_GASAC
SQEGPGTAMVSCAPFILGPLWIHALTQACMGEELSREAVLSWFTGRFLEAADFTDCFYLPLADSLCATTNSAPGETASSHCTYHVQPSARNLEMLVTSAHFWFHTGDGANSSAQLFIQTSAQERLRPAGAPSETGSDGWITYHLGLNQAGPPGQRALFCSRQDALSSPPRSASWSCPSAADPLSDCLRAEIKISFEKLGWAHWIAYAKLLTFQHCHGNCAGHHDILLGGLSFQYETLPNIIPEECICI